MRIARFAKELEQMLVVGWSLNMAIKGAWRRSHPDAERRTKDWIDRLSAGMRDERGASPWQ
jgi:hypothetical protein